MECFFLHASSQSCQFAVILDTLLGCPQRTTGCAQRLGGAHEFDCPLPLFQCFGDKCKTFQLMSDRAAVTDLLPLQERFTVQGQRFLIIAELPPDMCHLALVSGDTELISHFLMEIK